MRQQSPSYQIKQKLASSTHVLLLTLKNAVAYTAYIVKCKQQRMKISQQIYFYAKAWLVAFINT